MNDETYEVQGGQGHRIITRGLTYEAAREFARDFDRRCANAGLDNPVTRIVKERSR